MPVTVSRGCWIAVRGLIFRQKEWYRKTFTPCLFRWRETGRFFMGFGEKTYFCARLPKLTTAVSPCSLAPNS